jgi:transposase
MHRVKPLRRLRSIPVPLRPDLEISGTVDMLPATSKEALENNIKNLNDIPGVEGVSHDGVQHFIDVCRKYFPDAFRTRDRFHIIDDLLKVLQKARRKA